MEFGLYQVCNQFSNHLASWSQTSWRAGRELDSVMEFDFDFYHLKYNWRVVLIALHNISSLSNEQNDIQR